MKRSCWSFLQHRGSTPPISNTQLTLLFATQESHGSNHNLHKFETEIQTHSWAKYSERFLNYSDQSEYLLVLTFLISGSLARAGKVKSQTPKVPISLSACSLVLQNARVLIQGESLPFSHSSDAIIRTTYESRGMACCGMDEC